MHVKNVYLGNGVFRFLNAEHKIQSSSDWNKEKEWGKLWIYNLHYFDLLRQSGLTEQEGNNWISKWIYENPPPNGNGWEPYTLSLRIVNWIKWHLSGHPLSREMLQSLAAQVRFLSKRIEYHLLANHFLANAKALVFAGIFFKGKEASEWLIKGCEIYRRELPEQILRDGGHFERSPMYHSIILEDLLDLVNINAPLFLNDYINRMLHWLSVMKTPVGGITFFNDAADGIALSPEQLFLYAKSLGFSVPEIPNGSFDLPDTGYAKLVHNQWTVFCDGAPLGPDYQLGHSHADTLSCEIWYGNTKLMTNCGTGEYIDTPLRREQRGTAGHNTIRINGKNSSETWGAHRVARRAKIIERVFTDTSFHAAHNGYAPIVHKRSWTFQDEMLVITDEITGDGQCDSLELFWHFTPHAKITNCANQFEVILDGECFEITMPEEMDFSMATGHYSPEFGLNIEIPV